jgi:hypothetical protein
LAGSSVAVPDNLTVIVNRHGPTFFTAQCAQIDVVTLSGGVKQRRPPLFGIILAVPNDLTAIVD